MRLLLIRHASPAEEVQGRCYGKLDVGLSDTGRRESEELAAVLAAEPLAAVISSPAVRAVETGSPIAAAHGLNVDVRDGLRELDFGELEGQTYDEIAASLPELYAQWMTAPISVRFPGGEQYEDLRRRVHATVETCRSAYDGRLVAAVTHGGVVRAVVADVLEMPPERIFRLAVDHASVTVVEWVAGEPTVRELNRPLGHSRDATPSAQVS